MGDPVTIGIKVGMMALQMGLTAMNKIEGPRLDNLEVTTADYGTPLNYFWGTRRLEGVPIIWAEKLREKKNTSKGKGGKQTEYKYFGTFAVAIADHEINAVSRIWMDKHLVYDVTSAGPISPLIGLTVSLSGSPVKISNGRNMRIYLGTETQEPDPRMEAWCEDRYGADSCPAYKGVAYIVFQDLPLEKFGNRIPQVTVEAVNNSDANHLFETITDGAAVGPVFSNDGTRAIFYNTSDEGYALWDVPTRTKLIQGTLPAHGEGLAFDAAGNIWGLGGSLGSILRQFSPDGQALKTTLNLGVFTEIPTPLGGYIYLQSFGGAEATIYKATAAALASWDVDFVPQVYFEDLDGTHWTAGISGTTIHLYDVTNQDDHTFASPGGITGSISAFVNTDGNFVVFIGNTAVLVDTSFAVVTSVAMGSAAVSPYRVGSARFFTHGKEFDANTLDEVQSFALSDWTANDTGTQRYDAVNHALWAVSAGAETTIRYLDRISSSGVTLATVVEDVGDRCGVVEMDVSAFTQTVSGYSTVQGAGKDWISPLLDIHDCDMRPHDFAVQGVNRGGVAAGTISVTEFVREGDEPRYSITIKQDTDLPRRVALSFADADKDQQKNTVLSQRPLDGTDGDREQTIDLTTYVATPGDAQKFADRFFRRKWNGREQVTNALTAQYLALEPGDIWNLELDDVTQSHRLIKATISQGRINTEWERDFPGLHDLGTGTGAEMQGRDDDVIYVTGPSKGFVLDIPLVSDSHEVSVPQLYYAVGSYGGNFPGAAIYLADADGFEVWNAVESSNDATWGYATEALGNANPNLWDRGNSVNVIRFGDALTSTTEAAIEADPTVNLAYLGGELLNFVTATLESDGSYTLSGFKRGRRGTEWACDSHAKGDEFVLVADLEREGMGLSEVGTDMEFRAATLGRDASTESPIEVDFTGASLKPYSPARVKYTTDGTDLFGEIIRRTRVGGSWSDSGSVPVSETTEAYEIDVYVGATFKRTITISGTNDFTYTAAMMSADGTSLSSPPTFNVYQMSDAVGRGFALAA